MQSSASETHTGNAGDASETKRAKNNEDAQSGPKADPPAIDYIALWDKEGHPTPHPNPHPKHTSS